MIVSFISFILVILGCINWLCIGFFQYDFVAGLFGWQGSIFSRAIYIIIGIASLYLVYAVIRYKGRLTIRPKMENVQSNDNFLSRKSDSIKVHENEE